MCSARKYVPSPDDSGRGFERAPCPRCQCEVLHEGDYHCCNEDWYSAVLIDAASQTDCDTQSAISPVPRKATLNIQTSPPGKRRKKKQMMSFQIQTIRFRKAIPMDMTRK